MHDHDDEPDHLADIANWRPGEPLPPPPLTSRVAAWGRTSMLGGALSGWALAMQQIYEAERDEQIVIEVDADGEPHDLPIRLFLDPDDPSGSLCVVRRDPPPPVV